MQVDEKYFNFSFERFYIMSGSQSPPRVSKLDKMKDAVCLNTVALSCILVTLFMVGQWLQYKFIDIGEELFVDINCLTLPMLHCIMETVTFMLFISVNPLSAKDVSDKVEGIVIFFVCHIFGTFLSEYSISHSNNLYYTPAAFLCLPLLILQNKTCTGIMESPVGIACHCGMTCGAILMTSYYRSDNNGNQIIQIAVIFYFNLRNIMVKQLATGNIRLVLRMHVISTYVSILMLMVFIVGLLGIPSVTSFFIAGLFSSAASVVTLYLLLDKVLTKHSVFFVTVLYVWSRILLQSICVPPTSYGRFLTGGAIVSMATIIYVVYNSMQNDKKLPGIPSNCTTVVAVTQYELYTRMEFLIYMGSVIGLVICLLQPSISDRDRNNLQNIGLYGGTQDSVQ
ncbi:uncharacterized protein [Argopecten irradians]|uniref:uncharacterized protein n=1 Tax=Argopecten irradians TaxID=31199 RepID=UPI00371176DA